MKVASVVHCPALALLAFVLLNVGGEAFCAENTLRAPLYEKDFFTTTVTEGRQLSFSFSGTNDSDSTLSITSIGTVCGCTRAEAVPTSVAARDQFVINVEYDTTNKVGIQQGCISLSYEGLTHRSDLCFNIEVLKSHDIQPPAFEFHDLSRQDVVSGTVLVSAPPVSDFEVKGAYVVGLDDVTTASQVVDGRTRAYKISFRGKGKSAGSSYAELRIFTTILGHEQLNIPIKMIVRPTLEILPQELYLGFITDFETSAKISLRSINNEPMSPIMATLDDQRIAVTKLDSESFLLHLKFPKTNGRVYSGKLEITSGPNGREGKVTIPVTAIIGVE